MEMKIIALMNLRIGPDRVGPAGSLLSVVHGLKVLMKEDFTPTGADPIVFTWAPVVTYLASVMTLLVIPFAPGIFGQRTGESAINPLTHVWENGRAARRPVAEARRLLAEAGYPDGRDAKSGEPLVLYLDTVGRGPGDKPRFDWWRRQFGKISVQLEIRDTDWNRFQEKIRKGSQQLYILGWNADYPDPENFLFLLHGAQSRAKSQGENTSNYVNAEYDALFERMKNMPNSPARQAIIDRMVDIVRRDAPWLWGFHPVTYDLSQSWLRNDKPNNMARNNLKYLRLDVARRAALRRDWNRPVLWPLAAIALVLGAAAVPAVALVRRRERMAARTA